MTAEEILEKYEMKDEDGSGTDCIFWDDALDAMEEYASTKVQEALIKHSFDRENEEEHAALKLRDELMKFREWIIDHTLYYVSEDRINEYLTSLNDGRM